MTMRSAFARSDDGAVLPFVALASPLFIFFLALVVDMDMGRLTANKLQISADAAALAGVTQLPDKTAVDSEAIAYAVKNYKAGQNASSDVVLKSPDIYMGFWDADTRQFFKYDELGTNFTTLWSPTVDLFVDPSIQDPPVTVPSDALLNAVWVRTRRDGSNSLPAVFGGIAGLESYDITKVAIAVAAGEGGTGDCIGGGILSDTDTEFGSNNTMDNFCVYGRDYVKISSDNDINQGTTLVMENRRDYLPNRGSDQNNYYNFDEQVLSNTDGEWSVTLPSLVNGWATAMKSEFLPDDLSEQFTEVSGFTRRNSDVDSNNGSRFDSNRIYYVRGDVYLRGTHDNVFIVAEGKINIQDNAVVTNSVLLAEDDLYVSSDSRIGSVGDCAGSSAVPFGVYLWTKKNFNGQSNINYYATQVVAKEEFKMGSNDVAAYGLYAESTKRASIGSNNEFGGCAGGQSSSVGDLPDPNTGDLRLSLRQ